MGRAHEVRAASMAKTAARKSKIYSRFGKELYIAAKSGVPDPEMNLALKRKIQEAKSNQVPADVIQRAIDKAKGGDEDNYLSARYEGFGPGDASIIIDCLTDNTNRSLTGVKTAFNKCNGCKLVGQGSVSFNYEEVGMFKFPYEDEEAMLEMFMENDLDALDMFVEDGTMTIKTAFTDFGKTQDALEKFLPGVEFTQCEVTMLPNEYCTIDDEDAKGQWNRLLEMLDDVEDVNRVYHNVVEEAE